MGLTIIDIYGFISTVVVLISFMMKDIKKLRIITMTGSSMFMIYGIILGLKPVIVTNGLIVLINLYKLYKKEWITELLQLKKELKENS